VSLIYFHVLIAQVCTHWYAQIIWYAISETPCELRGSNTNVIGRCADVVKLGYQWRKRVVIYVSEIIRVSLVVFNLFFVSMSSVYILLAICIIVGVNSDEHTHIVSSIILLYLPFKGRYEINFVCVMQSVQYFDSLQ
jgi:hypothetical protein